MIDTPASPQPPGTLLAVGATGSIGHHAVERALKQGWTVRALTRDPDRAGFPESVEVVSGDLTDPKTLTPAVQDIDAVVFTHGTHGAASGFRDVDYGGVRNILTALNGRRVRISLMTAIGVTNSETARGGPAGGHDWKRRAERLVRASGNPYTIVRPSWFDYNEADQHRMEFLQGDTRWAGSPADGVISRAQIAQVLVEAISDQAAMNTTLELVAETGPAQYDLTPLFERLEKDSTIDGVHDAENLPVDQEPDPVRQNLEAVTPGGRSSR